MADNLITDIGIIGGLGVSLYVAWQNRTIHKLVNSQHGIALQTGATSARALMRAEPSPEHAALAARADAALALHEAQASNQKPRT